jgi:hypothetical protein
LKLSDFSINSIDCATALSSSISNTRMPVPFSRRSGRQVGRTCGTQNAFEQLIRILTTYG